MDSPLERLAARQARLLHAIESGEAIDYEKEGKIAAQDMAMAGTYYVREAIERVNEDDNRLEEQING